MIPDVPIATYRVQLTRGFGFDAAAAIVPYLQSLGISHLYASPIFTARPGSKHGYDVVDPTVLNPELGGEAGFSRLSDALLRAEIGLIVDLVPNHMCVDCADNKWWWDVLENGPHGKHGATFDVDWEDGGEHPRVLLPVLGRPYDECLDAGELRLGEAGGKYFVGYFDHRFPISPETYPADLASCKTKERLHELLECQFYRLAHWRLANSRINYRRFFDINGLAGVRVEQPEVFDAVHAGVRRLLAEGRLQGLRIDHIDGLADPAKYCADLQQLIRSSAPPGARIYVVVEKILAEGEELPRWPGIAGTTGYEWLNTISRVLVDAAGAKRMAEHWQALPPPAPPFDAVLRAAKAYALDRLFAAEFAVLARLLSHIAAGSAAERDIADEKLAPALRAYLIEFDAYRTYVSGEAAAPEDRARIDSAITRASENNKKVDDGIFQFLGNVLTLEPSGGAQQQRFVTKLQQLTGPVMAKGLEDMALYRDQRLLALNEVGNEPTLPPLDAPAFHARMAARHQGWPHGLTATATHDTKRGEDARMRILSIAELADDWAAAAAQWAQQNEQHAEQRDGRRMPSPQHEYMLYQAMIGGWPAASAGEEFRERLCAYAVKAAREGKQETSWLDPDEAYEAALQSFIGKILRQGNSAFLDSFAAFAERCALMGVLRSLSQTALKIMQPGVPDFYQGTEFWDLSFVDPDNRRPVDFKMRAAALKEARDRQEWNRLVENWRDGRLKLALTAQLLRIRSDHRDLFAGGDYWPVATDSQDIIAFGRSLERERLVIIAARNFRRATANGTKWPGADDWHGSVELPSTEKIQNLLHDLAPGDVGSAGTPAKLLLDRLPVAVLRLL